MSLLDSLKNLLGLNSQPPADKNEETLVQQNETAASQADQVKNTATQDLSQTMVEDSDDAVDEIENDHS